MPEKKQIEGGFLPLLALLKYMPTMKNYTKQSQKIIQQFGNYRIVKMIVYRKPIEKYINTVLNLSTFGKWQQAVSKNGYDKLFHLYTVVWLSNGNDVQQVLIEKNEIINIRFATKDDLIYNHNHGDSFMIVPITSANFITLNDALNKTQAKMGDSMFWSYNAFTNNCQVFIKYLLDSIGMLSPSLLDFIDQKAEQMAQSVSKPVQYFVGATTDLASKLRKLQNMF